MRKEIYSKLENRRDIMCLRMHCSVDACNQYFDITHEIMRDTDYAPVGLVFTLLGNRGWTCGPTLLAHKDEWDGMVFCLDHVTEWEDYMDVQEAKNAQY